MGNTVRTPIVNSLGVATHVHKKVDAPNTNGRPLKGFSTPPQPTQGDDVAAALEAIKKPTQDDYDAARERIRTLISNAHFPNGQHSWKTVIGATEPLSASNQSKYAEYLNRVIDGDPDLWEKMEKEAQREADRHFYERAFEAELPVNPIAEEYFESVWNDPNHNFGEVGLRRELDHIKGMKLGLEAGTLTPRKIIGSGVRNPKTSARNWLNRRQSEVERGLETRGRSVDVLGSNADYQIRLSEQGS